MLLAMPVHLPDMALVLLIGVSGSGKSTFARQHFKPTEIVSSDGCRALVADDEANQSATEDAFALLHFITAKRLARGRVTVIDATNVQPAAREPLLNLAQQFHVLPVAFVFDLPEVLCQERNSQRERVVPADIISRQQQDLQQSLPNLKREGFRLVHVFSSPEEVAHVAIRRRRLWCNRKWEHGPFDIIGPVHGCFDTLQMLLERLGYHVAEQGRGGKGRRRFRVSHPDGRKVVFVGDMVGNGPASPQVLRLVMDMVADGVALAVSGDQEDHLLQQLRQRGSGRHRQSAVHVWLEGERPAFFERVERFLKGLIGHYVLDSGRLVVAHAGMPRTMQGRVSDRVDTFARYGVAAGNPSHQDLSPQPEWVQSYRGKALVVYGNTAVDEPLWCNNTVNIETGACGFGRRLSALRYPEQEVVGIAADARFG